MLLFAFEYILYSYRISDISPPSSFFLVIKSVYTNLVLGLSPVLEFSPKILPKIDGEPASLGLISFAEVISVPDK